MERLWLDPVDRPIPDALRDLGLHPIVAHTLARRGITTVDAARAFLDPAYYQPSSPFDLPDMERGVSRLQTAIRDGEPILVWGDFDVDGQTSAALLVSALRSAGADVRYHIPHREREGHGILIETLTPYVSDFPIHRDQRVRVLLTCDTGITAHEAIEFASGRGVDVIVTDHHNLPAVLPAAYANINPKRLPADHPAGTLPGVGVAYKLIEALDTGHENLLDLVALGIVADVALQTGDARYLLQRGLMVLRQGGRPGLRALLDLAQIDPAQVSEETISFALAPRLNALGRLDDAARGVELLLTDDEGEARVAASAVERLNAQRKSISGQTFAAANQQIERNRDLLDSPILVLGSDSWAGGIVGIVANRLVEQYNRPVILFGGSDNVFKGSARSTAGFDVTAALTRVAESQPGLLKGYGGHTMAAGMTIARDRMNDFRRAINIAAHEMGVIAALPPALEIAAYVTLPQITLELTDAIAQLAPFGMGNPPLILGVRDVRVKSTGKIGRSGDHIRVTVNDAAGEACGVVWWDGGALIAAGSVALPELPFDLAFTARERTYKEKTDVQIEWVDARPAAGQASLITQRLTDVIDLRAAPDIDAARALAADLMPEGELYVVWGEGAAKIVGAVDRTKLHPAHTLIVWTAPGKRSDFRDVLKKVMPSRVILCCVDPALDTVDSFLIRLAGLVKGMIEKTQARTLDAMAAAMAHSTVAIRAGLLVLESRGMIAVKIEDDMVIITPFTSSADTPAISRADTETYLRSALEQTAAYRLYVRTASAHLVVR